MKYDKIFVNLFMEADTGELPSEAELKKIPVGSPSPTTSEKEPVKDAPPEEPAPDDDTTSEELPTEPVKSKTGLLGKANLLNDLSKLKLLVVKAKEIIIKNPDNKLTNIPFCIAKLNEIETNSGLFIRIVSDGNYDEISKFVGDSLTYINTTLDIFKAK